MSSAVQLDKAASQAGGPVAFAERLRAKKLAFVEEPLGEPATDGFGYAQLEFGERVGPQNRQNRSVAIKLLTGYHTSLYDEGSIVWEANALRAISWEPQLSYVTRLLDEFYMPESGVVPYPLALAKRMALHLLRGLAHTHERQVVHADLKPANFFFTTSLSNEAIETWLASEPARRNPPEQSHGGVVQSAVSQPLPMISEEEALRATFMLADYGVELNPAECIFIGRSVPAYRAPEIFLGAEWDEPAEMWTFGCIVYGLLTARYLFRYVYHEKWDLTPKESMLYQMPLMTQEGFQAAQLQASPLAPEFFAADCLLKKRPELMYWSVQYANSNDESHDVRRRQQHCGLD